MEQGNQNIPEKYSRGEHLKADTVNWLIDRAADSAAAKRVYKSDIEAYILDEIDEAAFDDSYQIPKPFDISCDVQQGVLAGVTLNNCLFYDGSKEVNLGNVDLTTFTNVSTIWLEKKLTDLSAASQSETAEAAGISSESTEISDKYQITTTRTDTSADYYRLYDIDSTSGNFFVKCDYRDAHIELGSSLSGADSIKLDEFSLNWRTSDDAAAAPSAQIWNYDNPAEEDKLDITSLSDTLKCRFIVRPEPESEDPDDLEEVQYASLSSLLSALSSEISSGGGRCSCDLTAYATSGDKLAAWTNGVKTVDIYSNVLSNDIRDIRNRVGYTPFFYDVSQQKIINNFFYVNRTLHEIHSSGYSVTGYGTYYLKISHYTNTDLYEIVQDTYTGLDTGGKQNTDTETYYKLWTIAPNFAFDWRQAPCIPFYERD